jgi:hypothetical protein
MGDILNQKLSFDERLNNLRSLYNNYSVSDQQYISDKLSDLINLNFRDMAFNLSTKKVLSDDFIKPYLSDPVYAGILSTISELKDYRSLEAVLYTDEHTKVKYDNMVDAKGIIIPLTPSYGTSAPSRSRANLRAYTPGATNTTLYNGDMITGPTSFDYKDNNFINANFNSQFDDQLSRNIIDRVKEEQKRLQFLTQNAINEEKSIKYIHELSVGEFSDQLANSIILLFKQIYTMDINGLQNSQGNYIYYGIIFIVVYIVLKLFWQEVST